MPQQPTRKACKECRRLRLGCDRSRSTIIIELQETIAELRNRNYLLEEALRKLHAKFSSEPHPLLSERTSSTKTGDNISAGQTPTSSEIPEEEIVDALDNFSIIGDGEVSLHGPTASAEYLVQGNPALLSDFAQRTESPMSLPPDIILLSALFPFSPDAISAEKVDDFVGVLPSYQTTLMLSNLFFQNFLLCSNAVPYDFFTASVLNECYPQGVPVNCLRHISPHIISILFIICGLGALANIDNSRRYVEAEEFHTIARAVLCLRPVYELPTLHGAQAMCLMLLYHMITERRSTGYVMALWSVLGRMCEMLNLNYDQRKLKKESVQVELREIVFWEIINLDSWPPDPDQRPGGGYETTTNGSIDQTWKYRYSVALDSAANQIFRQKGSTYSMMRQLDSGQAIRDNSCNPFQHPFAFSVKATLKASCEYIRAQHDIYRFQRMVLGTFISLFPMLDAATDALPTFDCACDMLASMEEHRVPSLEALRVLRNLHEQAHRAISSRKPSFSSDSLEKLGFWTNVPNPYNNNSASSSPPSTI
ncbi:hypothetical protein Clacol_000876 [Clathrus columnatus]|uniref:Transcription factor domain-containing protein n=1 Tax=Clathrus columnatus TaxID=1419009 RepID=A0AAV5A276_9AGAM|nr:hypothetical protein Clacol_000876 [Clathrus columnatus]